MMRVARALRPLYPQLNADLLIAGIVFHDSGKLWENHYARAVLSWITTSAVN